MERENESRVQPGENLPNDTRRQAGRGAAGESEGLLEEDLGEEKIGARARARGDKENVSSHPTPSINLQDIFFEYNMSVLKGTAEKSLRANAKYLLRHRKTRVQISGHTDGRGSNDYNLALGERRARTVKQFLEAYGISPKRIEIISYGEEKPFCSGEGEPCWEQNRRVHFSVKSK